MTNQILKKLTASLLAAAMVCGVSGCAAVNAETDTNSAADTSTSVSAADDAETERVADPSAEPKKDETVYVIADAVGKTQKIIVSDWLSNGAEDESISDRSTLTDIKNVKGDETFTAASDGAMTWAAEGNDIYYQGNSTAALPVGVRVSYQLDGKDISADEIAGKSGKVTIRFDYTNNERRTVSVNGTQETVYVPFLMMTGMLLDTDRFTNVSVDNGKFVNDGDHIAVMCYAVPGLADSLGAGAADVSLPTSAVVTADVTDFALESTMSVALDAGLDDLDLSGVLSVDDLTGSLAALSSASQQLVDGSSELYDGLQQLMTKTDALVPGVEQLYDGSGTLESKLTELADGAGQLQTYMDQLSGGLTKLSANSAALDSGARQVFQSLLDQANAQIAASGLSVPTLTVENYSAVLAGVSANLTPEAVQALAEGTARSTVTEAVKAKEGEIISGVTSGVQVGVTAQVLNQALGAAAFSVPENATQAELAALGTQMQEAIGQLPAENQQAIGEAVAAQMQSDAVQAVIAQKAAAAESALIEQNMQSADVQAQIAAAEVTGQSGYTAITSLLSQLNSYNEFYTGLLQYTAGVDEAAAGAQRLAGGVSTLNSGAQQLAVGAGSLKDGIGQLKEQSAALVSAISQLTAGADTLADGMNAFNRDGIQKLVDTLGGDIGGLVDRLQALGKVSGDYQNYSGIAEGMDGSVKFVFKTASVGE